jgi:hypothetical protein
MLVRYVSAIQLFFLITQLQLNNVWLGVNLRTYNIIKHTLQRNWTTTSNCTTIRIGQPTTLVYSILNTIRGTYVFIQCRNNSYTLP